MAVKNVSYTKSQLLDENSIIEGIVTDDTGMYFVPLTDDLESTYEAQSVYATHTHLVTETDNPIWNQVTYDMDLAVNSTELANGHVTLQGITDMGEYVDLVQHSYNATTSGKKIFDMYGSSCTNAISEIQGNGATAGTIDVNLPLQFEHFEDVDIMPNWYDTAWPYRISLQMERTTGQLRNTTGHSTSEYYGIQIAVPYMANMTDGNFTDIRFTADDGVTELDFYVLNYTASTMASVIVMVPWWFIDKERESFTLSYSSSGGAYSATSPTYIYCYYGNASATSASDITMGGNTTFYDDFADDSIDATKWPSVTPTANSTITETGGQLEIVFSSATGYTQTPTIISSATGMKFDGTDSFEIIWVIDEIAPKAGAVAYDGPLFRVYADEAGYFDMRHTYVSGSLSGSSAYHWNYFARSGSTSGSTSSYYVTNGSTTTDRFLKARYISSSKAEGGGQLIWSVSLDGVYWDVIGRSLRKTYSGSQGGPTSGDVKIAMYYASQSGLAGPKNLKIKEILVYPIAGQEMEYHEDHFTNGANASPTDMYSLSGTTNSTFAEAAADGSASSGTPGTLKLSWTNASAHKWDHTTNTAPIVYRTIKQNTGSREVSVYQTKIDSIGSPYANNYGGVFIANGLTAGTNRGFRWGVNRSTTQYKLLLETQSGTNTAQSFSTFTVTLPIHLRIVIDPFNKIIAFDYSQDGMEWKRYNVITNLWQGSVALTYWTGTYMGLFGMASTTNSGSIVFDYLKARTGMREAVSMLNWSAEEAYGSYPVETTTTDTDSMKISFPSTLAGMRRNNSVHLRLKPQGGEFHSAKFSHLTDGDLINIGPDGTDKYIGMRMEFDFELAANDTFEITGINYIYEVL